MNRKTSKKTRGFMCHSAAATAVCTVPDPRSVILPRRADRGSTALRQFENTRLLNNANYSRLLESHRFGPVKRTSRSVSVPSIKRQVDNNDHQDDQKPKPWTQKPAALVSSDQVFQVVVMRVAIDCQGCAGKVKKHLSKMEGVTSFSIDLETQRVTVMGHVSPVGVLESISKVKRAEFWPC